MHDIVPDLAPPISFRSLVVDMATNPLNTTAAVVQQGANIKFCVKLKRSAIENLEMLHEHSP